ncbi:MAG: alpha/beta hydrolase [Myxococcales bacterium]|nr:alpha/beta hydrolase [Myxococcales bacterium]
MEEPEYPGARGPERSWDFDSMGFRLRVHEWGDPAAEPILLSHGMWDHSRGFDQLAPLLAERYRLVGIDARGHGESAWADAYTWPHDVADIVRLLEHLGGAHLLGHSKGGGQVTEAAKVAPQHARMVINVDGFGPPEKLEPPPGMPERPEPGTPEGFAAFLDARRRSKTRPDWRPYGSIDELVARRKRMNPRLSAAWLRYFCWHGSRRGEDGVRWKADPMAGMGAGPWKPEWVGPSWAGLKSPMLAIVGSEQDTWGPLPRELLQRRLAHAPEVRLETVADAGHFPHMEQPRAVAALVLDFLEGG